MEPKRTDADPDSRLVSTVLVTLLPGIYFLLCAYSVTEKSLTADEGLHLASGVTYWVYNDYRLQPENGNLPQRLAALPLLLLEEVHPDVEHSSWASGNSKAVSEAYLFKGLKQPLLIFFLGRLVISLIGALCALMVFRWSRKLWGTAGGLISLVLFAFSPNLIAHGRLMTSDITFAAVLPAAVMAIWGLLHKATVSRLILAGLCVGLLCISKFSAIFIVPIAAALLVLRIFHHAPLPACFPFSKKRFEADNTWRRFGILAASYLAIAVVAWAVIWSAYGFRFNGLTSTGSREGRYVETWEELLDKENPTEKLLLTIRDLKVFPESFTYGFAYAYVHSRARRSFFLGDYSLTGWKGYFPFTFLIKTPLVTLALMGVALWLALRSSALLLSGSDRNRFMETAYRLSPILVSLLVIWAFAITSHLNIGHRHILAVYPFLFILCGSTVRLFSLNLFTRILSLVLGIAYVFESLSAYPNYIAYFNPLLGGPSQAYLYVVDSSLDWGQDLPQLKDWLDRNNPSGEPVYLSYFGEDDPDYRGIEANYLLSFGIYNFQKNNIHELKPGYYCVSVNMLQGVYMPGASPEVFNLRNWHLSKSMTEKVLSAQGQPDRLKSLVSEHGAEYLYNALSIFQMLRFHQLRTYLLAQEPEAQIGYSIFVYKLTQKDLNAIFPNLGSGKPAYSLGFPDGYSYREFLNNYIVNEL